ncbi:hypothetical protein D8Y22_06680 [Salinadaptatus halalkaliphilus]|uniref:Uncharacterized protein n=1 Tax=Salinadaptatus halalkaliphilus TaxID=2419781 RepID=A0A4S3TMZ4_9EURY|nr:hypothetical protein [Salinadaptatus halalkaliphilus]THE65612.1 hypothetical protein D8Y22_06680 [Salinadaptatus halalkaliphilus]
MFDQLTPSRHRFPAGRDGDRTTPIDKPSERRIDTGGQNDESNRDTEHRRADRTGDDVPR